jgi:hypothetical protein
MANNKFPWPYNKITEFWPEKSKKKKEHAYIVSSMLSYLYTMYLYIIFVVKMSTLKMSLYGDFLSSTIKIRLSYQFLLPQ